MICTNFFFKVVSIAHILMIILNILVIEMDARKFGSKDVVSKLTKTVLSQLVICTTEEISVLSLWK